MKDKMWMSIIFIITIFLLWLYLGADLSKGGKIEYGITFSQKYAQELGLDWKKVYLAMLDELKVKNFRLSAYWDLIEKEKNIYDFRDLDWQISQAKKHQAKIILAIGQRLPRWPECHWPKWAYQLSKKEREKRILKLISFILEKYKNEPTIIAWQVENEPFLKLFGKCPPPDENFYRKEIALVRSKTKKPIVISVSGELSSWIKEGELADWLGTSVYRITWNKHWGYFRYPLPPIYYYLKTKIITLLTKSKKVFVAEMQMEPWLGTPVTSTPLSEQYRSMNLKQFKKNLSYARRTGLSPIYFWGGEWWYWLKEQGDKTIWQVAKTIWSK